MSTNEPSAAPSPDPEGPRDDGFVSSTRPIHPALCFDLKSPYLASVGVLVKPCLSRESVGDSLHARRFKAHHCPCLVG